MLQASHAVFGSTPAQIDTGELAQAVNKLAAVMKPAQLQDIVDLSDVRYESDRAYIAQWKAQVATAIFVGVIEGKDWALELVA